jgi:putative membrane protein
MYMSAIVRSAYGVAAILSTVGVMSVYAAQTSAGQTPPRTPAQTSAKAPLQTTARTSTAKPLTDSQFVMKAAEGGKKEVALAKVALTKVSNADVKAFAQRMVTDHSAANDELAGLAKTKKIAIRASAPPASLPAAKGAAADKKYMEMMVKDHEEDVALFEAESQNAKDADLKAWVGKTLPTLRDHLKQARDVYSKISK